MSNRFRRFIVRLIGTDLAALDEALAELERTDPRKAQLVQLRFFAGLTVGRAA